MTKALKATIGTGKKPEDSVAPTATATTQDAANRPLWSRKLNRIDCSIWPHEQKDDVRYTVAISRSYLDRETNKWKRSFYFDVEDLPDVVALCASAEEKILELKGLVRVTDQD